VITHNIYYNENMNRLTVLFSIALLMTSCVPAITPAPLETIVTPPVVDEPAVAIPAVTNTPAVKIKQNDLIFLEFFAIT